MRIRTIGKELLLAIALTGIAALSTAQTTQKPAFEVARIKPSGETGQMGGGIAMQPGGRLVVQHMPLHGLLTFAYNIRDFQLTGGPSWMKSDFWDIEARVDESSIPELTAPPDLTKPNPIAIRLQSLLEDRFQLKLHTETRELPIYELSIAKGGSKMRLSGDQSPYKPGDPLPPPMQPGGPMPRYSLRMGRGNMEAVAMDEPRIVQAISGVVGRIIIDKTGLKGLYDMKLQWTPDPPASTGNPPPGGPAGPGGPEIRPPIDPNGPSIFTALEEQLGLKLESARGPVEVLVIESVSKATEN